MSKKFVMQYCKHCDTHNSFFWDCDKDGFGAYCPKCGKPLPLCDECTPAEIRNPQDCEKCKFREKKAPQSSVGTISDYCLFQVLFFNKKYDRRECREIMARSRDEAIATLWNLAQLSTEIYMDDKEIETRLVSYLGPMKKE